jgi:hypothetical protein
MDQPHDEFAPREDAAGGEASDAAVPLDDDERFIVGLVLTYYRRHPQRARTRLLDLLGEVLTPSAAPVPVPPPATPVTPAPRGAAKPAPSDDPHELWQRSQAGVAPLRHKHKR